MRVVEGKAVVQLLAVLCVVIIVTIMFLPSVFGGQLISSHQLERYGLVRVWYNQLAFNINTAKLQNITIEGDTIFAISSDAKIHALNTATGKLLWSKNLGQRELQHQAPMANSRIVAVVNNIELFVFDRRNGKLLLYAPLPNSITVTACEVSENYVYIPMLGGRIIIYPIEQGVAEKIFNVETSKYEYVDADISKPSSQEQQNTANANKIKNNIQSMKATIAGDLASRDQEIAGIMESFAQTKHAILSKPEIPPQEPPFVLQPPLNFPMSTISFGNLEIQPKISTQVLKFDPIDKSLKMHWEILTWISQDGNFHSSMIRDLSKTKIEQLYSISTPTKIFRPVSNQITELDWGIGKQIVTRPATSQTVPYFYSGVNFGRNMVPDLSVVGTKSGYVFAVKSRNGEVAWHFVASSAIAEQIGIIGIDVFVPTKLGMHNVNLLTGKEKWYSPNIQKFICASKKRLYVKDKNGFLVILDRQNGSKIASLDFRRFANILFNIETDRLFIVDDSGMIQCFAEQQADTTSNNIRYGKKAIPEIRHRLSAAQYAEIIYGKQVPDLYWVTSLGLSGKNTQADSDMLDNANAESIGTNNNVNNVEQTESTIFDSDTTTETSTTTDPENQESPATETSPTTNPENQESPTTDPENQESPATETSPTTDPENQESPATETSPTTEPEEAELLIIEPSNSENK
ncbi:MAG: PQQ-binding-like beta-propeller repeat protein [Planctomycetaceae bacterium]|nr:PQQ-binding-like beta-propeller repeat protein [Planctomycetaceae bacterium]